MFKDIRIQDLQNDNEKSLGSIIAANAGLEQTTYLPPFLGWDSAGNPVFWDLLKDPGLLLVGHELRDSRAALDFVLSSLLLQLTPARLEMVVFPRSDTEKGTCGQANIVQRLLEQLPDGEQSRSFRRAEINVNWVKEEMERRRELFSQAGVKDLVSFNKSQIESNSGQGEKTQFSLLPLLVIVFENFGELLAHFGDDAELLAIGIAAARQKGISVILAADMIEAHNLSRMVQIAYRTCRVAVAAPLEEIDVSRPNAAWEYTLPMRGILSELHEQWQHRQLIIPAINQNDVNTVINQLDPQCITIGRSGMRVEKKLWNNPDNTPDENLALMAAAFIDEEETASLATIKRGLRIGSGRARRVMDILEKEGYVSAAKPGQRRNVLRKIDD